MLCTGLIGAGYMIMLPKVFAERMADVGSNGVLGAGALVTVVYLFGAMSQYVGGRLADRFSMKRVYMVGFIVQTPLILLAATVGGWPLLALTVAMGFSNYATIPAENGQIGRASCRERG